MGAKLRLVLAAILVFVMAFSLGGGALAAGKSENSRYIITFEEGIDKATMQEIVSDAGGKFIRDLWIINGAAILLPEKAEKSLEKTEGVISLREDKKVYAIGETLPWGVNRIDADLVWDRNGDLVCDEGANTGSGVKVGILDTGVDYDHPDLADNFNPNLLGYDYVNNDADPMDDNGHGTHCAGIAAAVDNSEGVIGVSPKASPYALKVLDAEGTGYESDVVAGVQWCIENGIQIISMSLGSDSDLADLHKALDKAYNTYGILNVAAAGNDGNKWARGDNVDYPAGYDSVIAVGATDKNDNRAVWGLFTASSTGPSLELAAPGDEIYSTYWDDTYKTLSGTSMACPHVTGTAALVFASAVDSDYDADGDGAWDASEVRKKLQDTAEDLGDPGRDEEFGYGLVDAEKATSKVKAKTMHVGDIAMSSDSIGRGPNTWYKAIASVPILNASDNPVEGATIEGHWSGAYTSDTVSETTDTNGKAVFETKWVKGGGTFTFTVDNVTKAGWKYDSSANVETSDLITVP